MKLRIYNKHPLRFASVPLFSISKRKNNAASHALVHPGKPIILKIKLMIVLLMLYNGVSSQTEWAPVGAKWHYSRNEGTMPTNEGYVLYESVKDTLIQEKTVRLISKTYYHSNGIDVSDLGNEYMYQENNKVFYLKNDQFFTLYDFNARAGDSWTIYGNDNLGDFCNYDPLGEIVVDSVKNITINDKELKLLYTSPAASSNWGFNDVIIEQVGCLTHMLPQALECVLDIPSHLGPLRCYSDSFLGNYKSTRWDKSEYNCDALFNYTAVTDREDSRIRYFPNPVEDYLNLQFPDARAHGDVQVEIRNINGSLLKTGHTAKRLFVGNLPSGVYYVTITTSEERSSFKFIKK
ncbi:T9SS C-terminal target domain-containing protein [Maribellus luteus]|uniref:T9SS C-terminal target domain-containing protein n=1 Tax=Maribellus luteus TaxID=2305463 RepID=A0A399SWZ8_9BACT|nr:T9SS type A sorting domain-containing protein [Maribellus luteus]RIJ47224.1 T9SS C-terminal target domain-containing protein [Maribellus luteus]